MLRRRRTYLKATAAVVKSRRDYREQHALQSVSVRNIRVDEELFLNYGMKSQFQ